MGMGTLSTSWLNPGTAAQINGIGGTANWGSTGNALADDGSVAGVYYTYPGASQLLFLSNFGISLPANAVLTGIELRFDENNDSAFGDYVTRAMQFRHSGSGLGSQIIGPYPYSKNTIWAEQIAGSSQWNWGYDHTPYIGSSTYGIGFYFDNGNIGDAVYTMIDVVQLRAHYYMPGDFVISKVVSSQQSGYASSWTPTLPPFAVGDLIVVEVGANITLCNITGSAGWTRVAHSGIGTHAPAVALFAKKATGGDTLTVSATDGGGSASSHQWTAMARTIKKGSINNIVAAIGTGYSSSGTTVDPPAVNPGTAKNRLWVSTLFNGPGVDFKSTPAGYAGRTFASNSDQYGCSINSVHKYANLASDDPGNWSRGAYPQGTNGSYTKTITYAVEEESAALPLIRSNYI